MTSRSLREDATRSAMPEASGDPNGPPVRRGAVAPAVLVVIVHFGSVDLTVRAVESVLASTIPPAELIVVDNDPRASLGDVSWSGVQVLRPEQNLGFASGVNHAVRAARAGWQFLWLLNNDAVASPSALAELLAVAAADGATSLVSSHVLEAGSDRAWFETGRFYPWRLESRHAHGARGAIPPGEPSWRRIPYLSGCSLLIPAIIWERAGTLDESYFVYGEDVDYCIRARRSGFWLRVADRSVVQHAPSSGTSAPQRQRLLAAASLRLTARLYPLLAPYAVVAGAAAAATRGLRARHRWLLVETLRGYVDVIARRGGPGRGRNRPKERSR